MKLVVWEATTPVEGAKMGVKGVAYLQNIYASYRENLSDESARDVVLAVESGEMPKPYKEVVGEGTERQGTLQLHEGV